MGMGWGGGGRCAACSTVIVPGCPLQLGICVMCLCRRVLLKGKLGGLPAGTGNDKPGKTTPPSMAPSLRRRGGVHCRGVQAAEPRWGRGPLQQQCDAEGRRDAQCRGRWQLCPVHECLPLHPLVPAARVPCHEQQRLNPRAAAFPPASTAKLSRGPATLPAQTCVCLAVAFRGRLRGSALARPPDPARAPRCACWRLQDASCCRRYNRRSRAASACCR